MQAPPTYADDAARYFGVVPSPAPFDFQYINQALPASTNGMVMPNTSPGRSLPATRRRRASNGRRPSGPRTLGALERFDEEEVDESGTLVVISRSSDGIPPPASAPGTIYPLPSARSDPGMISSSRAHNNGGYSPASAAATASSMPRTTSSSSPSSRSASANIEQRRVGYRRRPKSTSTVLPVAQGLWIPEGDVSMTEMETQDTGFSETRSARRYYASPAQISLRTLNLGWPVTTQTASIFPAGSSSAPTMDGLGLQQQFLSFPPCPSMNRAASAASSSHNLGGGFSWGNARTFEDVPMVSSPLTAPPQKRISAPSSPVGGSSWDDGDTWSNSRPINMTSSMHELPTSVTSPVKRKRRASAEARPIVYSTAGVPRVVAPALPLFANSGTINMLAHRGTVRSEASSSEVSPMSSPRSDQSDDLDVVMGDLDQDNDDAMSIVSVADRTTDGAEIIRSPRPRPGPGLGFSTDPAAATAAASVVPWQPRARQDAPLVRATTMLLPTFQTVQEKILAALAVAEQESSGTESVSSLPSSAGALAGSSQSSKRMSTAQAPYYPIRENEELNNRKYRVVSILGRGSFGIVVRAKVQPWAGAPSSSASTEATGPTPPQNSSTQPTHVAIKIIRKGASFLAQGKREFKVLSYVHQHCMISDEAHNFIVNAIETFFHEGHLCIVFELLSDTLFELLQRSWSAPAQQPGLSLRMVCKMAHQLLCALVTLRNLKVIHCDLKPENIALTSPNRPRIKILDFGSCCFASEEPCNQFPYIQSRYYRAPEVLLGTGYSCAIDVWSLGCIMVELFVGKPLFIGENAIQQLYRIIDVLGMPPESMLRHSAHLSKFFKRTQRGLEPTQPWPGRATNGSNIGLRALISAKPEANLPQHVDYFIDLVSAMLRWDPAERISPLDALNHAFVLYGPRGAPSSAAANAAVAGNGSMAAQQHFSINYQQSNPFSFPPSSTWNDRPR